MTPEDITPFRVNCPMPVPQNMDGSVKISQCNFWLPFYTFANFGKPLMHEDWMTSTTILAAARAKLVAATHSKIIMLQLSGFLKFRCKNSMQESKTGTGERFKQQLETTVRPSPHIHNAILYCAKCRVLHRHNADLAWQHYFEFWSAQRWSKFPRLPRRPIIN